MGFLGPWSHPQHGIKFDGRFARRRIGSIRYQIRKYPHQHDSIRSDHEPRTHGYGEFLSRFQKLLLQVFLHRIQHLRHDHILPSRLLRSTKKQRFLHVILDLRHVADTQLGQLASRFVDFAHIDDPEKRAQWSKQIIDVMRQTSCHGGNRIPPLRHRHMRFQPQLIQNQT